MQTMTFEPETGRVTGGNMEDLERAIGRDVLDAIRKREVKTVTIVIGDGKAAEIFVTYRGFQEFMN